VTAVGGIDAARRPRARTPGHVLPGKVGPHGADVPGVPRTALVNRLRASAAPLALVLAPAGYGKTTLLRAWSARDRRPFAWLSLDAADDDPAVLLDSVGVALARGLGGRTPRCGGDRLSAIADVLADASAPCVLVLDDAHLVGSADTFRVLATLVEQVAHGSTIAVSGRTEPGLPVPRLRMERRVFEVREPDLRLAPKEADALLRASGIVLSPAELVAVTSVADGWPAGLELAAESAARTSGSPAALGRWAARFSGRDRLVVDYVRDEILSRVGPAERRFLVRTAILERLCGSLCDAVLGESGSAGVLERLEAVGCPLTPLDERRDWYRYHPLFRGALLVELERNEPRLIQPLHTSAVDWAAENGLPELAIEHADAAGDTRRVAEILNVIALPAYDAGRGADVARWFSALDDVEIDAFPGLGLRRRWVQALAGAAHVGDGSPAKTPGRGRPEPAPPVLDAACADAPGAMRRAAQEALEAMPEASDWRAPALVLLGVSLVVAGDDAAHAVLEQAILLTEPEGSEEISALAALARAERAVLALATGDWELVQEQVARACESAARLSDYPVTSLVWAAAARAALRRGEHAVAQEHVERAERTLPSTSYALPWLAAQVRVELGRACLAVADLPRTQSLIQDLNELLGRRPGLGLVEQAVDALQAELAVLGSASGRWARPLTPAELRLVRYLATHLSFREIANLLYVSRNTVKTQAISIYRKLGVSSRSEAVARAAELGLLDAPLGLAGPDAER